MTSDNSSKGRPYTRGTLATAAGVKAETIRYYEAIGLLPEPDRTAKGYRQYGPVHLQRLSFIRKGRALGFGIDDIRALLDLAAHPDTPCRDADHLVAVHLAEVERKIAELQRLRDALRAMSHCEADCVAECHIIDALASPDSA